MIYGTVKKKRRKIYTDRGRTTKYFKYKNQEVEQWFNMLCYVSMGNREKENRDRYRSQE